MTIKNHTVIISSQRSGDYCYLDILDSYTFISQEGTPTAHPEVDVLRSTNHISFENVIRTKHGKRDSEKSPGDV